MSRRQRHVGPARSITPKKQRVHERHAAPHDWVLKGCHFVEGYRDEESLARFGVVVVFNGALVGRLRHAVILMLIQSRVESNQEIGCCTF